MPWTEVSSMKQIWDALKILDSADFDQPEASSEVLVPIMSGASFSSW